MLSQTLRQTPSVKNQRNTAVVSSGETDAVSARAKAVLDSSTKEGVMEILKNAEAIVIELATDGQVRLLEYQYSDRNNQLVTAHVHAQPELAQLAAFFIQNATSLRFRLAR